MLRWYGCCGTERVEERDTEKEACDSGKAGDRRSRQFQASSPEQIAKGVQRKVQALWSRVGLTDVGEKQRLEA